MVSIYNFSRTNWHFTLVLVKNNFLDVCLRAIRSRDARDIDLLRETSYLKSEEAESNTSRQLLPDARSQDVSQRRVSRETHLA